MISKENMGYIHSAIKIYNDLVNKVYLIAYRESINKPLKYMEIRLAESNFWHLTGCRLPDMKENADISNENKAQIYNDCLMGKDISSLLYYTEASQDVKVKCDIIQKVFNFVSRAKELRIVDTENTDKQGKFYIGIGKGEGLIGYDKKDGLFFPRTAQHRTVFLKGTSGDKINFVISRPLSAKAYGYLEFKVSDKVFSSIQEDFYIRFELTYSLKQQMKNSSGGGSSSGKKKLIIEDIKEEELKDSSNLQDMTILELTTKIQNDDRNNQKDGGTTNGCNDEQNNALELKQQTDNLLKEAISSKEDCLHTRIINNTCKDVAESSQKVMTYEEDPDSDDFFKR